MSNFVHLHGHSEYSSLDGFSQISHIVKRVKENKQTAIALTDHGNLNGAYKFYTECSKNGIKPIMGIELYVTEKYSDFQFPYHLTILCKDNNGWENLLKMHKISYHNFYYKPRVSFEDLFKHKNGLVCLSGCPSGPIPKNLRENNYEKAEQFVRLFLGQFKDDFYLELMDHGFDFQKPINHNLRELSKQYSIPAVATNDYHYCYKKDSTFQDYLVCDQLKKTIYDDRKIKFECSELYIKDAKEMIDMQQEELDITKIIADKCDVKIESKGFLLPHVEDQDTKFNDLIRRGLEKYKIKDNPIYLDRLREEYRIIKEADLVGYFLVVHDYIEFAKRNNILVGPGRGSVGGCLIAYLMGIHTVDPIKHKLLFSRFYNAGRSKSLPDIDTDFPEHKIHLVREYVREKYGQEKVAHIGTYTYLHKKSALKLICRVLGVDFGLANDFSKVIEDETATKELIEKNPNFADLVKKAENFEGLAVHSSVHAAGIVISPIDLENLIPLRINKDNGLYISCWDMKDVESIGLVKFDFLSLNTLDVIEHTLENVGISLEDIPTDDQATFDLISNTNNVGVFQLSSAGISKIANDMKCESIDDIAVVVALYRPGPINSGLHIKYINRKHGDEKVEYLHEKLKPVLEETYGIFVFQEQIIQAAMTLAGYNEIDADNLRKAIGKKIPKLMKENRIKFVDGCVKNGVQKTIAQEIWREVEEFAEYAFNRAHSVEYGYITYYTAYLKAHYPTEFMAAILNNNYNKSEKLSRYLRECDSLGIEVVPPSVTVGSYNFKAKDGKIIFGLKGVKGIGEKTAKEIYQKQYTSFEDFCDKFNPSSDTIVALAEAGAFDEFGYKRNQIINTASSIAEILKKRKKVVNPKAKGLFKKNTDFNLPDVKELPDEVLASREYDRLNTYLVYDPLKGVDLVVSEVLEGNVFVEGYIISVREYITKKKETMAFINLATPAGQLEALVFPKTYRERREIVQKGTFVAIEGRVEEENKILTYKIWEKK